MAMLMNNNRKKSYIKIGADRDYCIVCAMKKGIAPDRDIYETQRSLQGELTNKPIIYLNQRGFEQCICMDCVKEIALENTDLIEPTVEVKEEVAVTTEDKKDGQAVEEEMTKSKGKGKTK